MSFSIPFISLLQFSLYRSFTSLVKFIPKYFNFCCNCKWNCLLSGTSLLVYRNKKKICILILYPVRLPKNFFISHSFLMESSQFLIYTVRIFLQPRDSLWSKKNGEEMGDGRCLPSKCTQCRGSPPFSGCTLLKLPRSNYSGVHS